MLFQLTANNKLNVNNLLTMLINREAVLIAEQINFAAN